MATETPKLNLRKPGRDDYVSVVTDINNNMDILDNAVMNTLKVNGLPLSGDITVGTGVQISGNDYKIKLGGGS